MTVPPPPDHIQAVRLLERFAENLVELRRRSGRSQIEVASHAGVHRTEIGLLERRKRMPGLDTVIHVAAGLEADPAELLEGLFWTLNPDRFQPQPPGHFTIDGEEVGRP
jgi:transcriptional regulator with XRE-family HTH domain